MPAATASFEHTDHASSTRRTLPLLVGFYFGFRSFILVLSVHLLGVDPPVGTALNLATGYCLLFVVVFCTLGESSISLREMCRPTSVRWAFLFLGFSGASLLWSSTASLSTSIAYWCGMATDVAIVAMLLRTGPARQLAGDLMEGYVWGASMVAVIAWIMPAQSDLRLGDEELLGANQIGYLCGFAFFFAQYLMREEKRRLMGPAFLLAVTLLRTLSKTTIAAFLVSQGFLLLRDKSISRRNKILAVVAASIVVAASWSLLSAYYDVYSNTGNQSTTLTGRLGIWAYILAEAIQQPWIGHGFDSVWKVIPPFGADQFEAAHAHNEFIQQFYAYGAVGVLLLVGIYFSTFRQIRRLPKGALRTFLIAFLIFVLVRGFADTERFDLSLPLWAIVMLSLVIEQVRGEQAAAPLVSSNRGNSSAIAARHLPAFDQRPIN
jgi:exopolysaccharide production protein ExoQ